MLVHLIISFYVPVVSKQVHAYQGEKNFSGILINLNINIFLFNSFAFNEIFMGIKPKEKTIGNRYKIN